jgi:hypothetical protein
MFPTEHWEKSGSYITCGPGKGKKNFYLTPRNSSVTKQKPNMIILRTIFWNSNSETSVNRVERLPVNEEENDDKKVEYTALQTSAITCQCHQGRWVYNAQIFQLLWKSPFFEISRCTFSLGNKPISRAKWNMMYVFNDIVYRLIEKFWTDSISGSSNLSLSL